MAGVTPLTRVKHIPLRSCAGCGEKLPKRELIRIVRALSGGIEIDLGGKKVGRGAYLCPKEECWVRGSKKGRLDHALRSPLSEQDRSTLLVHYQGQVKPIGIGDVR